jgi:uncharacterized NAD(P)/FAD-binding protein YdhS
MAGEEVDLTVYATKAGTAMQESFADWLLEVTEYDPATAKTKGDAFRRGVILGAYLRPTFQRSEANHSRWEEQRAAKEEEAEERAAKRAAAKAAAKAEKPAKAAPAAPAKAAKAAKPAAPAKVAKGGPRKAAAKPVTDDDGNSPF